MTNDVEPSILLPSGARVLQCIYELVTSLQGSGHLVSLDDQGEVWVTPSVHENAAYILSSNVRRARGARAGREQHRPLMSDGAAGAMTRRNMQGT